MNTVNGIALIAGILFTRLGVFVFAISKVEKEKIRLKVMIKFFRKIRQRLLLKKSSANTCSVLLGRLL